VTLSAPPCFLSVEGIVERRLFGVKLKKSPLWKRVTTNSRTLLKRGVAGGGQAEDAPGVLGVGGVMKMGYGDGTSLGADGQAAKHACHGGGNPLPCSREWRRARLLFGLGFRILCAKRIYRFLLPIANRRSFSAPSENQGHLSWGDLACGGFQGLEKWRRTASKPWKK
jgi:hypothetical protein